MRPAGLRSFQATPRLPKDWDRMKVAGIHAFGSVFDLVVTRSQGKLQVDMVREGKVVNSQVVEDGAAVTVTLGE